MQADGVPPDPRGILTAIGLAVYDWDIAADRIAWAPNAAEVLGLPDLSHMATDHDFAELIEPGSGRSRFEAMRAGGATDAGSGVPYATAYRLRTGTGAALEVEDTGRWYAAADGRPAVAHGMLRVSRGMADAPGQRERTAFLEQLAAEMPGGSSTRPSLTVFALSIENLSDINDRHGFDGGDAAIAAVLARMRTVMRRRDAFARYSGNRFALALRSCPADQARIAADRLGEVITAEPVVIGSDRMSTRILIGAATAPDHATDAPGLLRRAEQALAVAKRRAGSDFVLFDPLVFRSAERPVDADGAVDVVGLLNDRRIVFARQPVVDALTRETAFSEALLRVSSPGGGVVNAADIVPAMERGGLVPLVDMRILAMAVEHLAAHPTERLSVNLSPLTLDSPDWLATLASFVGMRADIAPRLIVEVTETVAIRDPDGARKKLDAMKALGVTLAIDDFGAGHTSFKHLRNFPVDIVKIDGAFVQNLTRSKNDSYFVRTLVDLAHHLGLLTVAEWVEDAETAAALAEFGVDYLQGDYCGAPVLAAPAPVLGRNTVGVVA